MTPRSLAPHAYLVQLCLFLADGLSRYGKMSKKSHLCPQYRSLSIYSLRLVSLASYGHAMQADSG
jgi:hypothetical protein